MFRSPFASAALAVLLSASPGLAQTTLWDRGSTSFTMDGYIRAITLLHDRGFDLPFQGDAMPARESGSHGQVVRLKWRLEGARWRLELHDRLQVSVASQAGGDQVLGLGVGAEPERLVDLRARFIQRERVQAWHDVDRLSLIVHTGPVDVTIGRQAVTWGTSTLFPVADLWASFSPFEQDTEEKPGIDAARALLYPVSGMELDLVLAHRGSSDDLSAGARATVNLSDMDVWAGAGKFWRQLMVMGGITVLGEDSRWRAEAVLPWDMDGKAMQQPRLTLGVDWLGASRFIGAEYHYNGIGRTRPERYVEVLADPRFRRGESYYVGRHYAGLIGSWSPDRENRITLAANALANLGDRSLALSPGFSYDIGQSARVSLGGLLSFGDSPRFTAAPPFLRATSEFGTYGDAVFILLAIFF